MEMSLSALVAILVSLLLIGFFAGIEIAFISANKLSLGLKKNRVAMQEEFGETMLNILQNS